MGTRTLWAIHAGKTGDAETLFLTANVVALGWSKVGDLSSAPGDRESFKQRMAAAYPEAKEGGIPISAGQLFRFVHEVGEGDVVVYSSSRDQKLRFGRVVGSYAFSSDTEPTYPHRRMVEWFHETPRASLSKDALSELGSAMSFFRVKHHAAEFATVLQSVAPGAIFRGVERNPPPRPPPVEAKAHTGPRQLFTDRHFTLADILSDIDLGDLGLPDIQRPFVWSAAKVRDLFDSMYQGFPVGYLLFWATTESRGGARAIGTTNKQKTPSLLIVDGQQRLTSLYAVVRAKPVFSESFEPTRIEIAFRPRDGRFEVADAATKNDPEFLSNISDIWAPGRTAFTVVNGFLKNLKATREVSEADEATIIQNLERLISLTSYPFTALEIAASVEEEAVADIFVRINSEGVKLKQADFILTLLSVFWEEGRISLEDFSRASRRPPGPGDGPSSFNHFIQPDADQLLRVAIAVGFHRGRLKSVYQVLRGKDLETGQFTPTRRLEQFDRLRVAQSQVLDLKHWHLFLGAILGAGFRSGEMISSETALLYAYAFYLLGRLECGVDEHRLQRVIGRWFFASALTTRYSNSPETAMEADLARVKDLKSADVFVDALESMMTGTLTNDFWTITLPAELETSAARSPAALAFFAAQSLQNAPALFSRKRVAELLDPSVRSTKRALERHHLFPKKWLEANGVGDTRVINQAANFALLEWPDNIAVGKLPPAKYVPDLASRFSASAWEQMQRQHALPDGWHELEYHEFLALRRPLMAKIIRRAFESLGENEVEVEPVDGTAEEKLAWSKVENLELDLRNLVTERYRSRWGERAEAQMRKVLGEDAWKTIEKNRERHREQYAHGERGDFGILDYTYLTQLSQLMTAGDAWELFRARFRDKRQLEDLVKAITPVRNDRAHFRPVPLIELRRCQIACEDLLTLIAGDVPT